MELIIFEGCDKLGKSTEIKKERDKYIDSYLISSPNRTHFKKEFVDFYMKSGGNCSPSERQYYFTTDEQLEFLLLSQEMLKRERDGLSRIKKVFFDRLNVISSFIYRPPKTKKDKTRYGLAQNTFQLCLSAFKKEIESVHLRIFWGENPLVPIDTSEEMEKNWEDKNKRYLSYFYEDNFLLNVCNSLGIQFKKEIVKMNS